MKLNEYFGRIYPHIPVSFYSPGRKNGGVLVLRCFSAAGSTQFRFKPGKTYTSEDVPLERKLFDGSRPLTNDAKSSFHPFAVDGVTALFAEAIPTGNSRALLNEFGIPMSFEVNQQLLCRTLALQLKLFIDSNSDEADDVFYLEYQRGLLEPQSENKAPNSSLYPNDRVYLRTPFRPIYEADIYQRLHHTWHFDNVGTQTWRNRQLWFSNYDENLCQAESVHIYIPDTPPNKSVNVGVNLKTSGQEERFQCNWIMVDEDGNNCFPGSSQFSFIINTVFKLKEDGGTL